MATVSSPVQKGSPAHLENEVPRVDQKATAQAKKPAKVTSIAKKKITAKPAAIKKTAVIEQPVAKAPVVQQAPRITGTKTDWMRAAGIPENEWWAVDSIVSRESTWNPSAVNPTSGACGLAQALPCSKLGAGWSDPVVALTWQRNYVTQRYGGYQQAVLFWNQHGWY